MAQQHLTHFLGRLGSKQNYEWKRKMRGPPAIRGSRVYRAAPSGSIRTEHYDIVGTLLWDSYARGPYVRGMK